MDGSSDSPQSDLNDHADSSVDGSPGTSVTTSVVVATHSPTASTMTSTTSIPFSVIKAYSGISNLFNFVLHALLMYIYAE